MGETIALAGQAEERRRGQTSRGREMVQEPEKGAIGHRIELGKNSTRKGPSEGN
jgi:hypothetical protein